MSTDIIDCHIQNINNHISNNTCFKTKFFKRGIEPIKNYRPVSLLNILLKIYEKFLHENLTNYISSFFLKSVSAFRKSYKTKTKC